MAITQKLVIDYVLLGRQRGEINVVPIMFEDGKRVGQGDRYVVPVDAEVAVALLDSFQKDLEKALREHESVDQPAQPALPAQEAIVIKGKEVRPALPEVPARERTMKKTFPEGVEITW